MAVSHPPGHAAIPGRKAAHAPGTMHYPEIRCEPGPV